MPKQTCTLILFISLIIGCQKKEQIDNPLPPPTPTYTPIALKSSSFVLGNIEKGIQDTFQLQFNKAVQVSYIKSNSLPCQPNLERTVSSDGKTVKFYNLLCGTLGVDYKFEFSVKDSEGKSLTDSVSFSYYNRKLPTEGQIRHHTISPDNKYCWVVTYSPNRLYRFGLEDTTANAIYELNFQPSRIVFHPYNQKLYVLNYVLNKVAVDTIFVMNPANGNIEKKLTVPPDRYDNPQTHIKVVGLDFGYNGYGILVTGTQEYSQYRVRVFDSRYNDTIYAHPQWVVQSPTIGSFFNELISCQANYNRTKLYLRRQFAFPSMGVLDVNTSAFSEVFYSVNSANHYIVPNRVKDKLFVAQYLSQFIMESGSYGSVSQYSNVGSGGADFSYRANEENVMYYMNRGTNNYELVLLDYGNAKILMRCNVYGNFQNPKTTTDGKYLLAQNGNTLYLYDTDMFYNYR